MADPDQPQELSFAGAADNLATDHDVMTCYQFLLGRDPEVYVIQEANTQGLVPPSRRLSGPASSPTMGLTWFRGHPEAFARGGPDAQNPSAMLTSSIS